MARSLACFQRNFRASVNYFSMTCYNFGLYLVSFPSSFSVVLQLIYFRVDLSVSCFAEVSQLFIYFISTLLTNQCVDIRLPGYEADVLVSLLFVVLVMVSWF